MSSPTEVPSSGALCATAPGLMLTIRTWALGHGRTTDAELLALMVEAIERDSASSLRATRLWTAERIFDFVWGHGTLLTVERGAPGESARSAFWTVLCWLDATAGFAPGSASLSALATAFTAASGSAPEGAHLLAS